MKNFRLYRVLGMFLATMLVLLTPQPAHAYLDPGTGSYLIQILLATVLGGAFVFTSLWNRIVNFFHSSFKKKKEAHRDDNE